MPSIVLKKPVVLKDGRQFAVIDIAEPTIGGIAAHEMAMVNTQSETAALIAMLVAETGWPLEAAQKIAVVDMEALTVVLRPFESEPESSESGEPLPPTSPTS